ncbi:hypothetical protein Lnau_2364 [Legionella nautarum]|uniref:DUF551 domain-containing protein n=1 Tax=Legionella nautarum TaxID=45070 RepID=A0A0W0WK50_9GAMM|nr:DUF551 domain-containing protein [Legionella nautarum]KTD32716.1 hypothetical protein Lnau_2364 [Legionella nautarum]
MKWKSVDERPLKYGRYLALSKNKKIYICEYEIFNDTWWDEYFSQKPAEVTHWMELPGLTKE